MGKGKHKDYASANRKRYNAKFLQEYGMTHVEWCKWKKTHTKQEVNQKRLDALAKRQ